MSRLLLLLAIVVVVYLLIRSFRKKALEKNMPPQHATSAEDMVRCAHCGVHLPKGESVQAAGLFFCGAQHRDAHRK